MRCELAYFDPILFSTLMVFEWPSTLSKPTTLGRRPIATRRTVSTARHTPTGHQIVLVRG